jgi:hypothetical protein
LKEIQTLVSDIYQFVQNKDGWDDRLVETLSADIAVRLKSSLGESHSRPTLRLSQMGPKCPKALWHSIHTPDQAEPLPPWAEIKYSFGHIIEGLAVALARASGHEVTGEQDEVTVDGVVGHRDCVIDGCIVDVKSASTLGFNKIRDGSIRDNDSFGYLDQLDGYLVGSADDPLVRCKDRAYILAIDKTLGKVCTYEHHVREASIRSRIAQYREIIRNKRPPVCECETVPDGKSGNIRLGVRASYSAFKHCCFPHLRTFLYSTGPVYLSKVVRTPDVTEVDRAGVIVYH